MNAKVFINYRREDTAPYADRLYDFLTAHFGEDQVFIDIDKIEPGEDFVEVINRKVTACDIALVAIGPNWLRITDVSGKRRLDDEEDFVRMEIMAALQRKIRVIPVLFGGAQMPRKEDLPEALAPLSRRNAIELSETRFHSDVNRLIEAIEKPFALAEKETELSATPVALKDSIISQGINELERGQSFIGRSFSTFLRPIYCFAMDIADRSAKKKPTIEWATEWITTAGVIILAATGQIEAVAKIATSLLGAFSFAIQPILLLVALVWSGAVISAKTNTKAKESTAGVMPAVSGHDSELVYTYSQLLRNIAKLAFLVMVIALPLKVLEAANEVMPLGNVLYGYFLDLEEKPIDGVLIRVVSRSGRDITAGKWQSDSRGFYTVRATQNINRSDVLSLAVPGCQSQLTVSLSRNNDLPATYRLEAELDDLNPFFLHHLSCEKK